MVHLTGWSCAVNGILGLSPHCSHGEERFSECLVRVPAGAQEKGDTQKAFRMVEGQELLKAGVGPALHAGTRV